MMIELLSRADHSWASLGSCLCRALCFGCSCSSHGFSFLRPSQLQALPALITPRSKPTLQQLELDGCDYQHCGGVENSYCKKQSSGRFKKCVLPAVWWYQVPFGKLETTRLIMPPILANTQTQARAYSKACHQYEDTKANTGILSVQHVCAKSTIRTIEALVHLYIFLGRYGLNVPQTQGL